MRARYCWIVPLHYEHSRKKYTTAKRVVPLLQYHWVYCCVRAASRVKKALRIEAGRRQGRHNQK
eukprot:1923800-Rhodomonas_salina.2